MPIVHWERRLETGDPLVDAQHRQLLGLVNELHDAILARREHEVLLGALDKLARYVVEHFADEERLMVERGYPGYAAHKEKHDAFAVKARGIIDGYREGRITASITLSAFLADWVQHHIKQEDFALVRFLRTSEAGLRAL